MRATKAQINDISVNLKPDQGAERFDTTYRIIGGGVISDPDDEILAEGESWLCTSVFDTPHDSVRAIPGHDVDKNSSLRHTNEEPSCALMAQHVHLWSWNTSLHKNRIEDARERLVARLGYELTIDPYGGGSL